MTTKLKPLFKWSGGKKDELRYILEHIPQHYTTYLEPFVGGGAVYFHLAPKKAVISDIHIELIDFYSSIKEGHIRDIKTFMDEHSNTKEEYYKVRAIHNRHLMKEKTDEVNTPLENAKRFYYLRKTCYRGMMRYNKKGGFNIPFGRYKNYSYPELSNPQYEQLLQRTNVLKTTFETIFQDYNSKDNFMFLDPPYDSVFTDYGYCSFGKQEHERLAELFKTTKIQCLMIIGRTKFIEELYKDYIVGRYDKKYRFRIHSNRVNEDNIDNEHLIIKNY